MESERPVWYCYEVTTDSGSLIGVFETRKERDAALRDLKSTLIPKAIQIGEHRAESKAVCLHCVKTGSWTWSYEQVKHDDLLDALSVPLDKPIPLFVRSAFGQGEFQVPVLSIERTPDGFILWTP